MKIVVCIKQVPDSADIKQTEKNTIQREGADAIINPFDEFALEFALRIKDKYPETQITAFSMGPNQAKKALKTALAHGVDEAVLLSDKKFAGSDTFATATTLSQAIKTQVPDFDLIICGQFATDGDTGQTGPAIATMLDIPQITYVKNINFDEDKNIFVEKETERALVKLKVQMPALICTLKSDFYLRPALIGGYIQAHKKNVKILTADDIGLNPEETGFKGSPTYVTKAYHPDLCKNCEYIEKTTADEYALFLNNKVSELKERFCLNDE